MEKIVICRGKNPKNGQKVRYIWILPNQTKALVFGKFGSVRSYTEWHLMTRGSRSKISKCENHDHESTTMIFTYQFHEYNFVWVIIVGFKICDLNGNVICQTHTYINIIRSMQMMKQPKLIIRVLSSSAWMMMVEAKSICILRLVHHVFVPIIKQKNEGKGEKMTKWYSREVIGAITCVDIITTLNTTFDISIKLKNRYL